MLRIPAVLAASFKKVFIPGSRKLSDMNVDPRFVFSFQRKAFSVASYLGRLQYFDFVSTTPALVRFRKHTCLSARRARFPVALSPLPDSESIFVHGVTV